VLDHAFDAHLDGCLGEQAAPLAVLD
jgi:hypothetical protein